MLINLNLIIRLMHGFIYILLGQVLCNTKLIQSNSFIIRSEIAICILKVNE